jgi:hypothetical protein
MRGASHPQASLEAATLLCQTQEAHQLNAIGIIRKPANKSGKNPV